MKILLLNPPSPKGYTANRGFMGEFGMLHFAGGTILPPHNLLLAAAFLKGEGEINFLDAVALKLDIPTLFKKVEEYNPDVVFINSSTPTASIDNFVGKQIKQNLNSKLIFMGPHAVYTARQVFEETGADGIVINNTPETVQGVVKCLRENIELSSLKGIYTFRNNNVYGDKNTPFQMDKFPYPAWQLAPLEKYFYLYRKEFPYATIHSSIGCLFRCKFCPYPIAANLKYFEMSPWRVIAEMEYLVREIGVKMILFRDALFTSNQSRTKEICSLIKSKRLRVFWRCETSTEMVNDELLTLMAEAGCVGINFGIESVDEAVVSEMNCEQKRKDLAKVKQIFKKCRELGIQTFAFFVQGLPNDTKNTIINNVKMAIELEPDHIQFTFATPYPGTELYEIAVREKLLVKNNWDCFSGLEPVMATRYLTIDEVTKLNKWAYRKYFIRLKRILKEVKYPQRLCRRAITYLNWLNR